jgi:hypothetical protein
MEDVIYVFFGTVEDFNYKRNNHRKGLDGQKK